MNKNHNPIIPHHRLVEKSVSQLRNDCLIRPPRIAIMFIVGHRRWDRPPPPPPKGTVIQQLIVFMAFQPYFMEPKLSGLPWVSLGLGCVHTRVWQYGRSHVVKPVHTVVDRWYCDSNKYSREKWKNVVLHQSASRISATQPITLKLSAVSENIWSVAQIKVFCRSICSMYLPFSDFSVGPKAPTTPTPLN